MPMVPDNSLSHADGANIRPNAPHWITEELVRRTLEIWNPRYGFTLTRDDAVAMILAVSRLYGVLKKAAT